MHQTQFSEKIPYGGFSQIRSQIMNNENFAGFSKWHAAVMLTVHLPLCGLSATRHIKWRSNMQSRLKWVLNLFLHRRGWRAKLSPPFFLIFAHEYYIIILLLLTNFLYHRSVEDYQMRSNVLVLCWSHFCIK